MSRSTLVRLTPPGTILGYRKSGKPIFVIAGGSEPPNQPPATPPATPPVTPPAAPPASPQMAKDEQGNDLGYPLNTAVAEMTPQQQAAYWTREAFKQREISKQLQREREALQRQNGQQSGTVRDQQTQSDEEAVAAARRAGKREGATGAAIAAVTVMLQTRGKSAEDITELLGVVDPAKFLDDNDSVDTTKVANYVAKVAPATTGAGGNPGQGRQESNAPSRRDMAKTELQRRGFIDPSANRGAMGGLRK